MVATWTPAASAGYYAKQTGYYADEGGVEPRGQWYAPAGDHGLTDGTLVDAGLFERLFAAKDESGQSLITNGGGRLDRVPAFDVTLSAPRSVSLIWALGDERMRQLVEAAHAKAVRQTLDLLEREAAFARRGRRAQPRHARRRFGRCVAFDADQGLEDGGGSGLSRGARSRRYGRGPFSRSRRQERGLRDRRYR